MSAKGELTLWPLVAATYFMVSGGPYGLEDLLSSAGFGGALVALLVTPVVWSLPTALMVGELASALPGEGGYYLWVRRGLGPFWGFQEAWLSLAASVFDMAVYPTLFTLYLGRLWPAAAEGPTAIALGCAMIAACAAWNILGAKSVGGGSLALTAVLLVPFVLLTVVALVPRSPLDAVAPAAPSASLSTGILVAMWNYMGWDNASTVAGEVVDPQRTYPRAMLAAVALVTVTYVVPVVVASRLGLDPASLRTGAWVTLGDLAGGPGLARAMVAGGMLCGFGMFNALVLSYSRLPLVLADEGYLPRWVGTKHPRTGAPWVAITLCCLAYAACLGLGFERVVEIDVLLYGLSLLLEFAALVALRVREPALPRPFRVPGGTAGAAVLGLGPLLLIGLALVTGRKEQAGTLSALELGAMVIAAGPLAYVGAAFYRRRGLVVIAPTG